MNILSLVVGALVASAGIGLIADITRTPPFAQRVTAFELALLTVACGLICAGLLIVFAGLGWYG